MAGKVQYCTKYYKSVFSFMLYGAISVDHFVGKSVEDCTTPTR